ncbi:MAG TPA: hypothetical protein VFB59_05005, partial [Candidatus Saccharimonadales bacterium]|nr:hypothetical protein [Candidatus Saccharimonadales bacterium]
PLRTDVPPESLVVKIGSAVLVPTGARSLNALERLEQKLGRPNTMHYVMFPDEHGSYRADQEKTMRFPDSSIQPTVDVEACWNARSPRDFVEELKLRGYKATIDSFHISRKGKMIDGTSNWQALSERLLGEGMVREVHVSVGRNDFEKIDPVRYGQSVAELRALVDNQSLDGTPLGELAGMLNNRNWTGNVVIEATIPGLSATYGKMTPNLLGELHSSMTKGVQQMLPHIEWQSHFSQQHVVS